MLLSVPLSVWSSSDRGKPLKNLLNPVANLLAPLELIFCFMHFGGLLLSKYPAFVPFSCAALFLIIQRFPFLFTRSLPDVPYTLTISTDLIRRHVPSFCPPHLDVLNLPRLFYFYFMCLGVLPVWMSVLTFTVGPGPIKPSHERFHIGLYLEWCGLPERGCREQASLNILLATALSQHLCPATSPVILHSLLRASCESRALTLHGSLFLHDASNFMKNLYSVHTFQSAGS